MKTDFELFKNYYADLLKNGTGLTRSNGHGQPTRPLNKKESKVAAKRLIKELKGNK